MLKGGFQTKGRSQKVSEVLTPTLAKTADFNRLRLRTPAQYPAERLRYPQRGHAPPFADPCSNAILHVVKMVGDCNGSVVETLDNVVNLGVSLQEYVSIDA